MAYWPSFPALHDVDCVMAHWPSFPAFLDVDCVMAHWPSLLAVKRVFKDGSWGMASVVFTGGVAWVRWELVR